MTDQMSVGVDAHHHLWDLSRREQEWTRPFPPLHRTFWRSELDDELRESQVGATVVVQSLAVEAETVELLELAGTAGSPIAGVVGWTDLTTPDVGDRLAALRASPGGSRLVGIRHLAQSESDPEWLLRPDVRRGLCAVAEAGLSYDLLVRPAQLSAAVEIVRALPGLTFVLDHAGKPPIATGELQPWSGLVRQLAAYPNVAVKLSGLITEADHDAWTVAGLREFSDVVLDAFGPERTMFGSDWPVCLLAGSYADVVAAATALVDTLTPDERREVFGACAGRWYRLGVPVESGPC